MTTLREAAQQALEALEKYRHMMFIEAGCRFGDGDAATDALRAALAQEEQEQQEQQEQPNLLGWSFHRNSDGSIGIKSPPPKPGESKRTGESVYPTNRGGLHELLSKFVDHINALAQEQEAIAQNLQSRLDAALLLEERRQEIAQPRRETEQEPVAYTTGLIWRPRQSELVLKVTRSKQERYGFTVPLWTSPLRREWQSLSEEEISRIEDQCWSHGGLRADFLRVDFARAVEAKLKEKNT